MSDSDAVHRPTTEPAPGEPEVADLGAVAASTGDPSVPSLDLDAIERDLADVEVALARLDSGDYWLDEVTGAELDEALLAVRPTARRGAPGDE